MAALKGGMIASTPLEGVMGGLNLVNVETQYDVEGLRSANRMFGPDGR